jgi:glycerophosphoryl diester phosphodiesterase
MGILYLLLAILLLWLYMIKPRLRRPKSLSELKGRRYAHRGLHDIQKGVPENSLLAFRLAKESGYGIELDVHLSRDGRLVVEHDDTLRRTCGADLKIEETDWETLSALRLEGTEEKLPLLEEVFDLIDGKVPLLIELKVVGGNWAKLGQAVSDALKKYRGPYCIESFEPRALLWFRQNDPAIPRGQLAGNVRKESNVSPLINFLLKNLLVNALSRPDFVAYNHQDYQNLSFRLCRFLYRPPVFFWTVRSVEGETLSARLKATPIFEKIER